ncbi:MAG: DUF4426 domain-containing protein [Pseudomonadota bacterium]
MRSLLLAGLLFFSFAAKAEQKAVFDDYEVHYIVIPTTFLQPEMAEKYGIERSPRWSLLNISVLENLTPIGARVSATSKNLLSQTTELEFEEVREGLAVYYLALLRHSDEEVHQITVNVTFPDGSSGSVSFQQRLYHEG